MLNLLRRKSKRVARLVGIAKLDQMNDSATLKKGQGRGGESRGGMRRSGGRRQAMDNQNIRPKFEKEVRSNRRQHPLRNASTGNAERETSG
jgi:hypothetical protein